MSISLAVLTSNFAGPQAQSINLWLAHTMPYIQSRYNVACTIYDYYKSESGADTPCPLRRQLTDMYGIESHALPPLNIIDNVNAVAIGFIEELASMYEVILVNIFYWGKTIEWLRKYYPDKKVVYMSHSLLNEESISNRGLSGEDFKHNLSYQEKLLKHSDTLLFPSPMEESCARGSYGLEDKVTGSVYPLLLVPPPKRAAAQDDGKEAKFLFIGRNEYRKGLDTVVNSFYQYRNKYQNGSLSIVSDAKDFDSILKGSEKLTELKHKRLVSFLPWKNRRAEYLHMLAGENSILIAPSTYEPFNLVVMEAAMHGMRVIVSRTAGISELLHGFGDRAALVNPCSVEDILIAMEKFSNAPQPYEPIKFPLNFEDNCDRLVKYLFEEDLP